MEQKRVEKCDSSKAETERCDSSKRVTEKCDGRKTKKITEYSSMRQENCSEAIERCNKRTKHNGNKINNDEKQFAKLENANDKEHKVNTSKIQRKMSTCSTDRGKDRKTKKEKHESSSKHNIDKVKKALQKEKHESSSKYNTDKVKKALQKEKHENTDLTETHTIIVYNLAHNETEESIRKCFDKYGKIEKVQMIRNKDNKFIGKALVFFKHYVVIRDEVKLNYKILRIEKMKVTVHNNNRIFISKLSKNLTILELRNLLKEHGIKPKDIRMRFDGTTKKNIGYCHLTYNSSVDAKKFENNWSLLKQKLGTQAYFEYSIENKKKLHNTTK